MRTWPADSPSWAPRPAQGAEPNHTDPPLAGTKPGKPKEREALGRSRGGLTTRVHLLADAGCRPLARVTSAGQRHDSVAFVPLMGRLAIARRGRGRPRTRPGRVRADKAYSGKAIRSRLRRRGIRADYPRARRPDPQPAQARQRGRPAARVRPRRVQAAQYRRARLLPAPPAPRRRHPVRQARLRLPRHRRRGSDPDLAPRPHTTRSTGHALVRGSGRAACR